MVTVAATGAGLALPLLGAGAAHAADNGTWNKVAVCETGGMWSANTNDGFFGGLAITQDTWDQYGGDAYAPRPDLASRSQQITVAERILADLGPDAWPGCEDDTGLLQDTAPPDVDPGSTATPTQGATTPGTPSTGSTATPGSPTATGTPAVPSTPSTPVTGSTGDSGDPSAPGVPGGAPSTGAPTTPGTPSTEPTPPGGTSTIGTTAPEPTVSGTPGATTPGGTTTPGGGRHAKPYVPTDAELAAQDQATRTQAEGVVGDTTSTASTASTTGSSTAAQKQAADTYTVGDGDSLSGIANSQHVQGGWDSLYHANESVIGHDPNLIKPGQILQLDLG
ncbi:MAG TPA: transglycosylase family protein [Streptomyces sp.]